MATLEEKTSNSKPPQPDLSNSDPRHCPVLSPRPHADASLQEGGLPSDHAQQKMQPVKISDDRDPRGLIKERYRSILLSKRLLRTGSVLASTQVDDLADEYIPGGRRSGLKSAPPKARPDCLSWPHSYDPAERVCPTGMLNHVPHGKFDGPPEVEEMYLPLARPLRFYLLRGNNTSEGTSKMHNPVSRSASTSGKSDSIAHEHAGYMLWQWGRCSSAGTAKSPESAFECDVSTMRNVPGEGTSTMPNLVSSSTSPSSVFDGPPDEYTAIDIPEKGEMCLLPAIPLRFHGLSGNNSGNNSGPGWTILRDSSKDMLVQGAFALIGLKTSDASSPAQDVLLPVVAIVYTVGLLSTIAGKQRGSSIMEGIGSAAAVLGFLLTMILLLL
ncbi:uncharacterized protein LOC120287554 isoform X2 [Eucalyptus grandis]|uniref:uncharacterized protein LOC120287554 isoform X2 n=1 Tax=Eucalyptus grandis TaxID=71139 RepID=UPI00192ECBF1|nr:uncharacterized protein LOC120287554 isoform X2 [Eucalyptus grandis]